MSVVQVINQSTSKSERFMNLIRKLVLICLKSNMCIKASHIPTKQNPYLVHSGADSGV